MIPAILAGIAGLLIGAFGVGLGAAEALESLKGSREGAAAMAGFFYFGPFGGLAGALLGAGLALHFTSGSATWAKGLMISSAVTAGIGGLLFAAVAMPEGGASYSHVIEFELEVPETMLAGVDIPSPGAMWGAAAEDASDKPISQFFEKRCTDSVCVLPGSVAALGSMSDFRVAAHLGNKQYRLPLDLPLSISGPMDWSAWRTTDDVRVRWRIVQR